MKVTFTDFSFHAKYGKEEHRGPDFKQLVLNHTLRTEEEALTGYGLVTANHAILAPFSSLILLTHPPRPNITDEKVGMPKK